MSQPPEVSVIIVTTQPKKNILPIEYFERGSYDSYEILIQREDGICAARNRGIERAQSNKIVFIDDDAIPSRWYLRNAAKLLEENAILTGRTVQSKDVPAPARGYPWYDRGTEPHKYDRLAGCNMAFRYSVFKKVGLFDERLKWGHDETELARRIQAAGLSIRYSPELLVKHDYASSYRELWKKKYALGAAQVDWWQIQGLNSREMNHQIIRTLPLVDGSGIRPLTEHLSKFSTVVGMLKAKSDI